MAIATGDDQRRLLALREPDDRVSDGLLTLGADMGL